MIHPDGLIRLDHKVTPGIELPGYPPGQIAWLKKTGLSFTFPSEMRILEWFGKGPVETYPDRKTGGKAGIFNIAIDDIESPYIIPQDFDNRSGVRWGRISDGRGRGPAFRSDNILNVSVNPYKNPETAY